MYPRFEKHYHVTFRNECPLDESFSDWGIPKELESFFFKYEGTTFGSGIYRVPCRRSLGHLMYLAGSLFPELKSRILVFGIDWLGRIFALDKGRIESGCCQVLRLDPGFVEATQIPVSLNELHEVEFVDYADDCLSQEFFNSWQLNSNGYSFSLAQCVSYKVFPILGGEDVVSNLEISDIDVYWTLCAQVWLKIRSLDDGTKIGDINFGK